jgi:thioredoxin-related protein
MTAIVELSRRKWLITASTFAVHATVVAAKANLPTAVDLKLDLKIALSSHRPLLVMVSLEGCPFCKIVRENYLAPMREREGLAVVQIDMRSKATVVDFLGKPWTHDALIRSWGIKVAPSVLFFGQDGVEVAERMVGGYIPDFYGSYLNDRLGAARIAVQS